MQSQRWAWTYRYAVPMFVTALIAVLLTSSALVAVLVFERSGAAVAGEECLVGSWRTVSQQEAVPLTEQRLELVGDGPVVEYRADGTGISDHGSGTRQAGGQVVLEMRGHVEFEYEAVDGTFRYLSQTADGGATITVSGIPLEQPLRYVDEPFAYQCEGDTLEFTHEDRDYRAELARAGP
ncbi:hypothetical protein JQS43_25770 [Natronosporangium hydrolyticum]|uniref:Uncharacterized protein n=1 Tax=Natronosporangium hydrolyticum TaxID=2811111 RepID=A0A895YAN1_9ACTN|nr:hypothetical protein [Natronosporangium hydrolyticum]QSB14807.1 hypothetical protein JQS43_25770 [Natronosporangium hydrolyticum]